MKKEKGIYDLLVDKNTVGIEDKFEIVSNLDDIENFESMKEYFVKQLSFFFRKHMNEIGNFDKFIAEYDRIFKTSFDKNYRLLSSAIDKNKMISFKKNISENQIYSNDEFSIDFINEFKSCKEIKIIVPFIMGSMIDNIRIWLEESIYNMKEISIKILTTTYDGSSSFLDLKRLIIFYNTLSSLGAKVEIKIEDAKFLPRGTRIHSKLYSFIRGTGFSSTYVGSSNLTNTGIFTGGELNTKISEFESPSLFLQLSKIFEEQWNDNFHRFYIDEESQFNRILTEKNNYNKISYISNQILNLYKNETEHNEKIKKLILELDELKGKNKSLKDFILKDYQKDALDALRADRKKGNKRNLLVMATGTGKTVVAINDYINFSKELNKERPSLLFIAHQQEILQQAQNKFCEFLNIDEFGVCAYDSNIINWTDEDTIFATSQTLQNNIDNIKNKQFDIVIYDEVHHIGAEGNEKIYSVLKCNSKYLLGLTATPEREDNINIKDKFFNGTISYDLRLYDAIEEGMLCDFDYYMIYDNKTDLTNVEISNEKKLAELLSTDGRNEMILNNINTKITHIPEAEIRAVVFCCNKYHAENVFNFLSKNNKNCALLNSDIKDIVERKKIINDFKEGKTNYLIVINMLNEGIDIPDINVVLFARPTKSLTLFIQQLGRGLRKVGSKRLTVLDFVNNIDVDLNSVYLPLKILEALTKRKTEQIEQIDDLKTPGNSMLIMEKAAKEEIQKKIKKIESAKQNINNRLEEIENLEYEEIYKIYESYIRDNFSDNIKQMYSKESNAFINFSPVIINGENKKIKYNFLTIVKNFIFLNNRFIIEEIINIIKLKSWSDNYLVNGILSSPFIEKVTNANDFEFIKQKLAIEKNSDYIFIEEFEKFLLEIRLLLNYKLNSNLIERELTENIECLKNTFLSKPQMYVCSGLVDLFQCKTFYGSGVITNSVNLVEDKKFLIVTKETSEPNDYGYSNYYDLENNVYYWPAQRHWTKNNKIFKFLLENPSNFYFFNRSKEFIEKNIWDGVYEYIGIGEEVCIHSENPLILKIKIK